MRERNEKEKRMTISGRKETNALGKDNFEESDHSHVLLLNHHDDYDYEVM